MLLIIMMISFLTLMILSFNPSIGAGIGVAAMWIAIGLIVRAYINGLAKGMEIESKLLKEKRKSDGWFGGTNTDKWKKAL